jgi:starch-binding outer membrane protein, SusD/RagB family
MWLKGEQFFFNGDPIIVNTTNRGFDETYSGPNPTAPLAYHVNLTPDIEFRNIPAFDLGNDEKAWNMGYRSIKFYPDSTSSNRNANNDVPVFRYADIILLKAEAILRGGTATLGHTPLSLVNSLRSIRTTEPAWTSVDLEDLFAERSREFVNENWRRNDMIRFGKFEDQWGIKTDTDPNKRLFPIPTRVLQINPGMTQNPGYN